MGVNPLPTGGIYKYFSFDGVTSASFGVHLTGTGVFNAPTRAIEMVNIPARNGAFPQDMGYFENIEVTYTASIVADNETDFADAVSGLRNWLCSRKGYCRLEDDYNPDEYRMAVYKSGLEVEPFRLEQGEFEIVFDCKPQRFLKTGETAIDVTSGGTITNNTMFDAKPLLQVWGYGTIQINNKPIIISSSAVIGNIQVGYGGSVKVDETLTATIETRFANNGDEITIGAGMTATTPAWVVDSGSISYATGSTNNSKFSAYGTPISGNTISLYVGNISDTLTFYYGTSSTISCTATYTIATSAYGSVTGTVVFAIAYNGTDTFTVTTTQTLPSHFAKDANSWMQLLTINMNSTKPALGNPLYIDLETGEAYNTDFGDVVSSNSGVTLPAELPVLALGSNTITKTGANFTKIEIVPRWWKV